MAGYAAALRVLTGYTRIDGQDMTAEALRPRTKGQKGVVEEIIDFAVQVANEHLVPEGLPPRPGNDSPARSASISRCWTSRRTV